MNTRIYIPFDPNWRPSYERWRHGGWYVTNVRYRSGASGCVSRNFPDGLWRIVCDHRPRAHERYTYRTRDAAAYAEHYLANLSYYCACGARAERQDVFCGECGKELPCPPPRT